MINSIVAGLLFSGLSATAISLAQVNTLDLAEEYYESGDFDRSASVATSLNTADGYSLAARANLMKARYLATGKNRFVILNQALASSRQALTIQPDHLDAHLQTAMALGLLAEMKHPIMAFFKGYAKEGRHHLAQALMLAPDDPWSNGLLGIWHLQVVRRAPSFIGTHIYDASIEDGLYYCNRAEQLSHKALYIRFGCAVSLYELDHDLYKNRFHETMEFIVHKQPMDIEEAFIARDAKALLQEKPVP